MVSFRLAIEWSAFVTQLRLQQSCKEATHERKYPWRTLRQPSPKRSRQEHVVVLNFCIHCREPDTDQEAPIEHVEHGGSDARSLPQLLGFVPLLPLLTTPSREEGPNVCPVLCEVRWIKLTWVENERCPQPRNNAQEEDCQPHSKLRIRRFHTASNQCQKEGTQQSHSIIEGYVGKLVVETPSLLQIVPILCNHQANHMHSCSGKSTTCRKVRCTPSLQLTGGINTNDLALKDEVKRCKRCQVLQETANCYSQALLHPDLNQIWKHGGKHE
mmetsp:Transcript_34276/g.80111  ORF Transcript_34276/g.80111 Transcript_34276/m.80111 type:complete len:271 (-) Transcript_34276:4908-5720(-)